MGWFDDAWSDVVSFGKKAYNQGKALGKKVTGGSITGTRCVTAKRGVYMGV